MNACILSERMSTSTGREGGESNGKNELQNGGVIVVNLAFSCIAFLNEEFCQSKFHMRHYGI